MPFPFCCRAKKEVSELGWYGILTFVLPCIEWIRTYNFRQWLIVRGWLGVGGRYCVCDTLDALAML